MGSPTTKAVAKKQIDFYEALHKIMEGKSVHKLEWGSKDYYGILRDGRLQLHKLDDKYYDWILTDGDIYGDDFVVL